MVPGAQVPDQDVGPWQSTLERLLADREQYERLSKQSRAAAITYARSLSIEPFEQFLEKIVRSPKRSPVKAQAAKLSPEKQKLLTLRWKQRAPENVWLPYFEPRPAAPRLFCFPYAGAGALAYMSWIATLAGKASVCPLRLPSRSAHLQEETMEHITQLLYALEVVYHPHLTHPL